MQARAHPLATPDTAPGRSTRSPAWADRLTRLWLGNPGDPKWGRLGLIGLLVATTFLYVWGLAASGWANPYYTAAVQAGSESWKAFFFGSSDAANSITVDKPPFSLWPMALSVRILGLSSWAILLPQALMGVATVGLIYLVVRRSTGSVAAGLLAGVSLALTPVAAVIFRFNNPDALLVLLLVGAAAATLRAVEESRTPLGAPIRWLALGGALVGLGFLTKMLQAFLVLPALALAYLLFAQSPIAKRLAHLLVAFGSMVVAGGWWIAIVEFWPGETRPYIGGSQHNSVLELTFGYNGLDRISGHGASPVGLTGEHSGRAGIDRMFNAQLGSQVAWLLPAAILLGVTALWLTRGDRALQAAVVLWGTWLSVTGLTFSFMAGFIQPYYTVALAPAIAALIGIGTWVLWQHHNEMAPRIILAASVLGTALFSSMLLLRDRDYLPWLWCVVLVTGVLAATMIALRRRLPGPMTAWAIALAFFGVFAGPSAYSATTMMTAHTGSSPSAGPAAANRDRRLAATSPPERVTRLLTADAASYMWGAAVVRADTASRYQLASLRPVMPIGGFKGIDPSPTLTQFKTLVAHHRIHYFIGYGQGRGVDPGGVASRAITDWVQNTFPGHTVDGITLYDLSGGVS